MNEKVKGRVKQTELEELPEEWEVKKLRVVSSLCHGGIWGDAPDESEDVFPVIRSTEIDPEGNLHLDSPSLAYRKIPANSADRYKLENGDLLVVKSSGSKHLIGRVAFFWTMDESRVFLFSNFVQRLRANPDVCDARFVYYVLSSQIAVRELKRLQETTSGLRNLPMDEYLDMTIPVPPLPEQRWIAGILRLVDKTIDRTNRLVEQYQRLKKLALRHLLTKGIGHTHFKQTDLGELPEEWEVKPMKGVADVKGGKRLPKGHKFANKPTSYPYIRVVDFRDGSVDTTNLQYLTPEDYDRIKRYAISGDDVYISIAGTIGLVGVIPSELDGANLTENAAKIVIHSKSQLDRFFLAYYLSSPNGQHWIQRMTTKSTQPKLALMRIEQIPLPVPPLPEQCQIAEHLLRLDALIDNERRYVESLNELKRVWMNQLLTGKVRVPPEVEEILKEVLPSAG